VNAFFAMGGYGAYVWPSYGATFVVLGLAILISLRSHARAVADVRRLERDAGEERS
jgi:heme exporter protein CcmD